MAEVEGEGGGSAVEVALHEELSAGVGSWVSALFGEGVDGVEGGEEIWEEVVMEEGVPLLLGEGGGELG